MQDKERRQAAAERIKALRVLIASCTRDLKNKAREGRIDSPATAALEDTIVKAREELERLEVLQLQRQYCNRRTGSDVQPFEVVQIIGTRLLVVRPMRATPHGSSGVERNAWDYASDPAGRKYRVRLTSSGVYRCRDLPGSTFHLSRLPRRFIDLEESNGQE